MTRWQPSGYPTAGVFAGALQCRFRLCHVRDDGLAILTVGDQRSRGSRLEPVAPGFNFVSFVAREVDSETGEVTELERAACNDHRTALAQHMALLKEWENRE